MKKILTKVFVLLMIFSLVGCKNSVKQNDFNATGSFTDMTITSGDYSLRINSSKPGHPSGDSAFSTSANVEKKEYNGKYYSVWYDIDYSYVKDYPAKKDYSDIDNYKEVVINKKTFKYTIDSKTINLIYQPEKLDCYENIKVTLSSSFDEKGNFAKEDINISIDDLKNPTLSNTINFEITKK